MATVIKPTRALTIYIYSTSAEKYSRLRLVRLVHTPLVQLETAKKETENKNGFKGHLSLTRRRRTRGEDEHKDEIKESGSEEEEKGPKQGQGEGEGRYCILMLEFRR